MAKSLVLIGGGGHCKACIDVIETTSQPIKGIIDKKDKPVLGYPFLGDDDKINEFIDVHSFLITIGQIKSAASRIRVFEMLLGLNADMATVVSSLAFVSKHSRLGKGTIVMHQALINANATVGDNCIINNKALIEHDAVLGNHSHLSTGAIINGECIVGNRVFIGSNSVVAQGVEINDDVVIGAGSVVVKNITEAGIYAGNPARKIKE